MPSQFRRYWTRIDIQPGPIENISDPAIHAEIKRMVKHAFHEGRSQGLNEAGHLRAEIQQLRAEYERLRVLLDEHKDAECRAVKREGRARATLNAVRELPIATDDYGYRYVSADELEALLEANDD